MPKVNTVSGGADASFPSSESCTTRSPVLLGRTCTGTSENVDRLTHGATSGISVSLRLGVLMTFSSEYQARVTVSLVLKGSGI